MSAAELRLPSLEPLWTQNVADYVTALTVSHDGACVAAANGHGEVVALDTETGGIAFRIQAHEGAVFAASFCPRSRRLATTGQDGSTRVFDGTGALRVELTRGDAWSERLAWSPNGELLATAHGRVVSAWNQRGQPLFQCAAQESPITGLGWH